MVILMEKRRAYPRVSAVSSVPTQTVETQVRKHAAK